MRVGARALLVLGINGGVPIALRCGCRSMLERPE